MLHVRVLRTMAQRVIDQYEREHCFGDWRRTNADTGIVPAFRGHRHRFVAPVDRAARQTDARGRLYRERHLDVLTGRDAAEHATGVVARKTGRGQLIAVFAALLRNAREPGADLHSLDGV